MAKVLAVLCSGRKSGYTAGLLQAAVDSAQTVRGVEIDLVRLHDYSFKPCTSCFACIRDEAHRCVLDDDMGRRGEGELFRKVIAANGLILADPVHLWGASAMCHLFFERLYPVVWSGELAGMPFMSVSCASNQGMQHVAVQTICRWAFTKGMRYVGQLAAHVSAYQAHLREVHTLGRRLAEAAVDDARARQPYADDAERFLAYADKPWNPIENYLQNLTRGTMRWEDSLPEQALRHATFKRQTALELLEKASDALRSALGQYHCCNIEKACALLVEASACWTHATWAEFLEEEVIGRAAPAAYRPIPGHEGDDPGGAVPQAHSGQERDRLILYVDGASRGNPGPSAAGVVICDSQARPVERFGRMLPRGTSNMAEYRALLLALKRAQELGATRLAIYADSELLVRQTNGEYKVKSPKLRPLAEEVKARLAELAQWEMAHVPREQNAGADELANRALDSGADFVEGE